MNLELPPLPYAKDALEPVISEKTVTHHYEKHHRGYLVKLAAALEGNTHFDSLEQVVLESYGKDQGIFNLAAQVWNHNFYWQSLTPGGGSLSDPALLDLVDQQFGSLADLTEALHAKATSQFGSGWAWLTWNKASGKLAVSSTSNAETPLTEQVTALLTIDVWEHAYYLDYQQDRSGHVRQIMDQLLNWEFASDNLKRARAA